MNKVFIYFLFFLFCSFFLSLFAYSNARTNGNINTKVKHKNPIIYYEPAKVVLSGTLDLQTFPGPPNYESIKSGDEIETHFYLKLKRTVDVIPRKDNTDKEARVERNVKIVQLSIAADDDALWAKFRKNGKGKKVQISGSLFHRFTGHHHSRVIMLVEKMIPEKCPLPK